MAIALLGWEYRRYQFVMWRPVLSLSKLSRRGRELLEAVGLWGVKDAEVRHLSYGHQRQLEIAVALAAEPKLLLLDEPTAGLSHAEIAEISVLLRALPDDLTVLVVEHHLEMIFQYVERVLVLHQGRIIADDTPEAVRRDARVRSLYFGIAGDDATPAEPSIALANATES
jgi:branched-chain amino acid transport system ATP-binding protein